MVKREVRWSEKRKFALWATEGTLEKTKAWYKKDNCFSRSEFIEKAIDFYVGYLSSEENESYLPNIVISTLKGLIAESDNKQNRMLFKLAVEMSMMMNLMAATQDIDKIALERLRGCFMYRLLVSAAEPKAAAIDKIPCPPTPANIISVFIIFYL